MKKVTITLPSWIGQDEAQDMVVRDLRAHAGVVSLLAAAGHVRRVLPR